MENRIYGFGGKPIFILRKNLGCGYRSSEVNYRCENVDKNGTIWGIVPKSKLRNFEFLGYDNKKVIKQ